MGVFDCDAEGETVLLGKFVSCKVMASEYVGALFI